MNRYRISYINVPTNIKNSFAVSSCILIISVGQSAHEGEKFISTLKSVNSYFKRCVILIADTLQRHTIGLKDPNATDSELYSIAKISGDEWLERNLPNIKNTLDIEHKISRWDYWLSHKNFESFYKQIVDFYKTDAEYKSVIESNITDFLSRMKTQDFDAKVAFTHCERYLLEECAIMRLWVEEGCQFQLYPKGLNPAMEYTNKVLVEPFYPNLLKNIGFHIRKIN